MKIINMICPNCGASLQIDADKKAPSCNYCGSSLFQNNGVQNLQYGNPQGISYQVPNDRQSINIATNQHPKKNRIWLWVLGWIFIFPVPLTILLLRNKTLDKKIQYGGIAAAWVVFLIIGYAGSSDRGNNNQHTTPPSDNKSVVVDDSSHETINKSLVDDTSEAPVAEKIVSNISEIHLINNKLEIMEGRSESYNCVRVTVDDKNAFSPDDIIFVSENPEIATIEYDHDALTTYLYYNVSGVSPGETYVYAKSKDGSVESEHIMVTVEDDGLIDPESITIQDDTKVLAMGESYKLVVNAVPENASINKIHWSSSDDNVVSVDEYGKVSAVGGGTATITAEISSEIKATCELTVDNTLRIMAVSVKHSRDDDVNIGHEWSYSNAINSEPARSSISLRVGDTVNVYSKYTESDDNPDIGEASASHYVTEEDLQNGFDISMDLYVTENGGRNSGQNAHFIVTYSFSAK